MRDKETTQSHLSNKIVRLEEAITFTKDSLVKGKVNPDMIVWAKYHLLRDQVLLLTAQYSVGEGGALLKEIVEQAFVDLFSNGWPPQATKVNWQRKQYDEYGGAPYSLLLHILSLGVLFRISDDDFSKIASIIDRDNVSDDLYEFILSARLPDRVRPRQESYTERISFPPKFTNKLRLALHSGSESEKTELLKQYMSKDFYNKHTYFYLSKNSPTYCGLWAYEVAAIVVLLGLDDRELRKSKHYPADLADYYRMG